MNYLLVHYFRHYVFLAMVKEFIGTSSPDYIKFFYYKAIIDFMPFEQSYYLILF